MRISNIIAKWKNEYSSVWLNRFCMETLFCCLLIHHCSWFTLWVGRGAKNAPFNMNLRFFRHQLVYPGRRGRWFGQPLLGWVIYLNREILIYYIHIEKYSPKSYVVNFRTQISSSQSEERTMVFTREKNDTSNQKPQRCVSFAPKFPPFIAACSAASHIFNEKSFTQRIFLAKKVKKIFVCFTVDKENGREPAKQQRKGINRTRRKLLLCFLSELLCLSF